MYTAEEGMRTLLASIDLRTACIVTAGSCSTTAAAAAGAAAAACAWARAGVRSRARARAASGSSRACAGCIASRVTYSALLTFSEMLVAVGVLDPEYAEAGLRECTDNGVPVDRVQSNEGSGWLIVTAATKRKVDVSTYSPVSWL